MGGAKRQLEEEMARAHEEYVKESLCPKCGDEREEVTFDHNTFWLCDQCDGDHERFERELDEISDVPPEDDDLWGLGGNAHPPLQAVGSPASSPQPALDAAEREAIEWSINDQIAGGHQDHPTVKAVISVLRGLLERTKGGER